VGSGPVTGLLYLHIYILYFMRIRCKYDKNMGNFT